MPRNFGNPMRDPQTGRSYIRVCEGTDAICHRGCKFGEPCAIERDDRAATRRDGEKGPINHTSCAPEGGAQDHVPGSSTGAPSPERASASPAPASSLLRRLFHRREPTFYQRCLAVHMHFTRNRSALR